MFLDKFLHLALMILSIRIMTEVAGDNTDDSCPQCPGLYCGRMVFNHSVECKEKCGACDRGYRTDSYFCQKCDKYLELYDWLFLGFMALSVTVLNFYAIDMFHSDERKSWLYHLSALLESVVAFICMVLYFEPSGKLQMYSCSVKSLKDWYTVFYNPKYKYIETIRCTQEAVYPLYTSMFLYLVFCLLTLIIFRGIILRYAIRIRNFSSLYAGFYIIPVVGVIHVCFAGIIYYVYPYLILFLSAIGVAVFLSTLDREISTCLKNPRDVGVVICYCIAHGYGIVSITEMSLPARDGPVLLLVFLPVSFYVLAKPFTVAENFKA